MTTDETHRITYKTERVDAYGEVQEMQNAYSLIDGSYIGNWKTAKYLANKGIRPQLSNSKHRVSSIGKSVKDGKWYGWSHRAIFGFGIGHTVKKGDCGYVADNPEELIECHATFFSDISPELAERKRAECAILEDRSGIRILRTPIKLHGIEASEIEKLGDVLAGDSGIEDLPEMTLFGDSVQVVKCGPGEWTAETDEDCRWMAIEFAEGVS